MYLKVSEAILVGSIKAKSSVAKLIKLCSWAGLSRNILSGRGLYQQGMDELQIAYHLQV